MNNFLITAMGRSGTKYLQAMMNYSITWRVKHEPDSHMLPPDHMLGEIQARFDKETAYYGHYGEVNSTLRYMAMKLQVDKKGILIRDPVEVWISIANRRPWQVWLYVLGEYERSIEELEALKKAGAFVIDFNRMIMDKIYLIKILSVFGIEDAKINNKAFKMPLHVTEVCTYESITEFESKIRDRVKRLQEVVSSLLEIS